MANKDLAIRYKRQYASNIDADYEFTTDERNGYLSNPLRYAGQVVYDSTEDKLYRLNSARTAWTSLDGNVISVNGSTGIVTLTADSFPDTSTTNKWFTNARVLASALTGYVIDSVNSAITTSTTLLQYLQQIEFRVGTKLDILVSSTTGTALTFITDRIYGSESTPETGNITGSTTGAIVGVTNLMIHNSGTEPTIGGLAISNDTGLFHKLGGTYKLGVKNYIFFTYLSSTRVIYTISQ